MYGESKQAEATAAAARARPWLITAAVAICWGVLTFVALHIVSARNPVVDTLSSYALTSQGTGMLAAGILTIAVGSLLVLGALTNAGVPVGKTIRTLFGTWSGGLALAAAFPASYTQNHNPVSGEIHQYSCLVAFLSLPAIGFALLDRLRESPALAHIRTALTRWTWVAAGGLILFGVSYLFAKFPHIPVIGELSAALPVGLTQRIALMTDLGLLFALLVCAGRAAARSSTRVRVAD